MIIISASSDNGVSAQSERCTILEFNAIATPALGRESSSASSARLEAHVSVGFPLIFTIIVSMFFDGGMFGKEKRIMTQSHYPGTFIFPTHFLRQHYLLQVNGYNLSRIRNPAMTAEGTPEC